MSRIETRDRKARKVEKYRCCETNRIGSVLRKKIIGAGGTRALSEANNKLDSMFCLRWQGIGDSGARVLADTLFLNNDTITNVDLSHNEITPEGAKALAGSFTDKISVLDLSRNKIGAVGVHALTRSVLRNSMNITSLFLSFCKIGDAGAELLADAFAGGVTLTELDLGWNGIGDKGTMALVKAVVAENSTLEVLSLGHNNIGAPGAISLSEGLVENKSLLELKLRFNRIGCDGASALAKSLDYNDTLTTLDLTRNEIGDEGAMALKEALQRNSTLEYLWISKFDVNDVALKKSPQKRKL